MLNLFPIQIKPKINHTQIRRNSGQFIDQFASVHEKKTPSTYRSNVQDLPWRRKYPKKHTATEGYKNERQNKIEAFTSRSQETTLNAVEILMKESNNNHKESTVYR